MQIVLGDLHGLNTLEHQPAKLAAMEGLWEGGRGVPASLIGWPDAAAERNLGEIAISRLGSLYLTHSWDGEVKGLKDFPADQRPPVAIVYFAFRIMVGIAMPTLPAAAMASRADGQTPARRHRMVSAPLPVRGRPRLRRGDRRLDHHRGRPTALDDLRFASHRRFRALPSLTGGDVLTSLLLYVAVYLIVYPVGLFLMLKIVRSGPSSGDLDMPVEAGRLKTPFEALPPRRWRPPRTATLSLVPIWTAILGVGVFFFDVALDGFDLGVGILDSFAPGRAERNLIMNSIAPVWDGNETWLVLGCVGLFAAFPLAFAIIIPAVYFPILMMLLALIFRGLAFEFRYRDAEHRTFWDHGFAIGSALAAFSQGVVLGAFVQGFNVEGRQFVGGSFDCFTPFSIGAGLA